MTTINPPRAHRITLNHCYDWTRRDWSRFKCIDCSQNVVTIGDFCMVNEQIWKRFRLGWRDNLCMECMESRLGRKLRPQDFSISWPIVKGFEPSPLLQARRGSVHPFVLAHDIFKRAERRKKMRRRRTAARR